MMLGQTECAADQASLTFTSRAVLAEIPAHRDLLVRAERRRRKFFNDFSRAGACTCVSGSVAARVAGVFVVAAGGGSRLVARCAVRASYGVAWCRLRPVRSHLVGGEQCITRNLPI